METQYYSLVEISQHNGKDGAKTWVVIKDNVYDLTNYLEEHPGGGELISEWAGKDGTKAFDEFGHSGDAKRDLKQFKVGELREEDRKKKQQKKVTNGGTPKVVEASQSEKEVRRSCIFYLTCGACGF